LIKLRKILFARLVGAIILGAAPLAACAPTGAPYGPGLAATSPSPLRYQAARAPEAPKAQLAPDPDQLIGLDTSQVEKLLGAANLRRREPPAQVWQYEDKQCVLHLFLYEKEGDYRVEYYEARDPGGVQEAGGVCLASLIDGHGHATN